MGICQRLAACIADPRDPARVIHRLDDILRARIFAISCDYEDADDLDALRDDPGFRLALGKLPGSGTGLASQPTISRRSEEHTSELQSLMRISYAVFCLKKKIHAKHNHSNEQTTSSKNYLTN